MPVPHKQIHKWPWAGISKVVW